MLYQIEIINWISIGSSGSEQENASMFSGTPAVEDHTPFQIEPKKTIIEPNSSTTFKVIFLPYVAASYSYSLKSKIQSLHPDYEEMSIAILAMSEVAKFYFEIEDTDYLTRRPGNRKCVSEDIPNPKVIEFDAIGIGVIYKA